MYSTSWPNAQFKNYSTLNSVILPSNPKSQAKDPKKVTLADILEDKVFAQNRNQYHKLRRQIKKARKIEVGPNSTVTFQNYDLIWMQVPTVDLANEN